MPLDSKKTLSADSLGLRRWFGALFFRSVAVALSLVTVSASVVEAEAPKKGQSDSGWTSFQNGGHPIVDSMTEEVSFPSHWTPDTNIVWKADITGYGQSTPIVAHGQVFVTSTSGENKDKFHCVAYSIDSGEPSWRVDLTNPSPFANTPMVSRAAPSGVATAEGFIALFEGGVLVALSDAGERLWEKNLVEQYGKIDARHGLSASLEQDEHHVYVWIERSEQPYIIAVEKISGEIRWKADGVGSTSWASPRLIPVGNQSHLVCSASGKIIGMDPSTGDRLWVFDEISNNTSCTPVPAGNARFLIGASDGRGETSSSDAAASNGLVEIKPEPDGSFSVAFKWSAEKATSTFGSPVAAGLGKEADGRALFVNRAGVLYQHDLETGRQISADRTSAGGIWATPIVVGENVYLFGYRGTTAVIDINKGNELQSNRCWPEPAEERSFGGGKVLYAAAFSSPYLFVRRGDKLYAIVSSMASVE